MSIIAFTIELMGAVMLLLYAVRMVRTGIERRLGATFRRAITGRQSHVSSAITGLVLAVVLQSSAAVALLASGFAAAGYVGFAAGVSLILGADLGSALIIQILSFDLSFMIPLLLAIGGWLFIKSDRRTLRQTGRILMGIAFILLSLELLRNAVEPIRDGAFLPAVAGYLESDLVTAFIVGAALAFIMHSSVAAILVIVTLVQIQALPLLAGLAVVLGANLGSGLIAVWLTRGMPAKAIRLPVGNLIVRGSFALAILPAIRFLEPALSGYGLGPGQTLVLAHILFNSVQLVLVLPLIGYLEPLLVSMLPDGEKGSASGPVPSAPRALTPDTDVSAQNAIASLRRELLRMSEQVERMFIPVLDLYKTNNPEMITALREIEDDVDASLEAVRTYVASLPMENFEKQDIKTIRGLMDYAIRLESAGDVVVAGFSRLAKDLSKDGATFSKAGWDEISRMYDAIVANLSLANNVLVSEDIESARLLVEEKSEIKRAERQSRKRHLDRLSAGRIETHESSNVHLETIRALRDFNSHISAIAYPPLHREGQLLETRLVREIPAR